MGFGVFVQAAGPSMKPGSQSWLSLQPVFVTPLYLPANNFLPSHGETEAHL